MAKHHHHEHEGHHGKHHAEGGPIEAPPGTAHYKHGGHAGHKGHHHGHKKHRASGGRTDEFVSGNPDVMKEAHDKHGTEKKRGGKVHKAKHHGKHHRATGGVVPGLMTGGGVRPRLDKPGRKSGGRVGADKSPLSSAHKAMGAGGESAHGQPD